MQNKLASMTFMIG